MKVVNRSPCKLQRVIPSEPEEGDQTKRTAMYDVKCCPQTPMGVCAVHSIDAYFTRHRVNMIPDAWPIGMCEPFLLKK